MRKYWQQLRSQKELTTIILGALSFAFILVATLNLTLSFLVFVIFVNLAIFQKSFHYGWIFSILIITIFPTIYVTNNLISLEEIFTLVLAIIGLGNVLFDNNKIKLFPLFYYWLAMTVLGGILIFFGNSFNVSKEINQITLYQLIMVFVIYPMIIISFQYFFQTSKRLEKFFLLLIFIGSAQALFGLLAKIFNWELVNGVGVTGEIFTNTSIQKITYQITGFFGDKLFLQLGDNLLAMLLLITIPITLGIWLIQKYNLSTIASLNWTEKSNLYLKGIIDSVFNNEKINLNKTVDLKTPVKLKMTRQRFFLGLLIIQISALILTFSYMALIVLGIGILIMGILLREEKIIFITLISLVFFIVALPGFEPTLIIKQKSYFISLWQNIKDMSGFNWLLFGFGESWRQQIYNSYLMIFAKLGILGLAVFLLGLWQYFSEIRQSYLKSDGFERIWLVVILAIFIEFVLMGLFNNVFFVGPVALLFWLLYGVLQNLKYNQVKFGLTETRIGLNGDNNK